MVNTELLKKHGEQFKVMLMMMWIKVVLVEQEQTPRSSTLNCSRSIQSLPNPTMLTASILMHLDIHRSLVSGLVGAVESICVWNVHL